MASKDMIGSLPHLAGDIDRRDRSGRPIELKALSKSSACLTTKGPGSDSVSKASSFSRDKSQSWYSSGFQLQYTDIVVAGAKMGDHEKMMDMLSKLGTEGFAAIIREHDGKNNGPLHYAALNNDVLMTKLLIQYGADVNDIGKGGKRPLHFAAIGKASDRAPTIQSNEQGDLPSYAKQADSSSQSSDEKPDSDEFPLRLAKSILGLNFTKKKKKRKKSEISLKSGEDEVKHPLEPPSPRSVVPSLAERDENPNNEKHDEGHDEDDDGEEHNDDENIVDILLAAGADASATDTKGTTPLHLASMHANMDAFKRLQTAPGVDINAQDRRGATPLLIACKAGNTDGALVLIDKGADILISDINGDTPLHLAVRHSHTLIVTSLIEMAESKGDINEVMLNENSRGVIPLYDAVKCGHRDLFQVCLDHVSKRTSEVDMMKLMNFAGRDNDDAVLHVAAAAGYQDIVEALIANGAVVNLVNFDGQTPLHLACEKNHESIALCLVENGAAIVADSADLNPLQVAVNNGSFETLMSLLQYISAASGGQSDEATHILQWSAANNKADILRKILDYEFRFHEMTDDGIMDFIMDAVKMKHKETVHVLVRWNRAVVDHRDKLGNTPLHHAAEGGHQDIAQELIQAKAQVNATNGEDLGGLSPLHYVADRGWTRTARVLLDAQADIEQTDSQLMTPLHHACKEGNASMVDLLLYGKGAGDVFKPADVTVQDAKGLNCLDHAIDNGRE